jgi:hypothetical protein
MNDEKFHKYFGLIPLISFFGLIACMGFDNLYLGILLFLSGIISIFLSIKYCDCGFGEG